MKKHVVMTALVCALLLCAVVFVVCVFALDGQMTYEYTVTLADGNDAGDSDSAGTLRVYLAISSPFFRKLDSAFIYLGDKDVKVAGCFDTAANTVEAPLSDDGVLRVPVPRAGTTTVIYDVPLSVPAKHGLRGSASDDGVVFDGDQAFLFPAPFYLYDDAGVRRSVGKITFKFEFPAECDRVIQSDILEQPGWRDIYALSKNAFVFGNFLNIPVETPGLFVYAQNNPETQYARSLVSDPTVSGGVDSIFRFYKELFGQAPAAYNVVLLPKDADEIIGGAGTSVVASTFDPGKLRDWQLLSHRMFHAFFDTASKNFDYHKPPNLWLIEGLSTYYENTALEALPDDIKAKIGVDANRQFALMFDQYLYMRIKDPSYFTFRAMDEASLASAAKTEFLHYTAAPLIVKLLIDESFKLGKPRDALLKYCQYSEESAILPLFATIELLGESSQAFCESYMLGTVIPPLWELKRYQPKATGDIIAALNDMELLMESWRTPDDETYRAHIVTETDLSDALETIDVSGKTEPFLPVETEALIRDYCPEMFALLNSWYILARENGVDFGDPDLRSKLTNALSTLQIR